MPALMFVAVEGPNGVGKSTIIAELAVLLARTGVPAHLTREPTESAFGRAIRDMESKLDGRALAMACAADRLYHLTHEIEPALRRGEWVLSDRYLPSSLVLQRLDGLGLDEIFDLNRGVRPADLVIYLESAPSTLRKRLAERNALSRLERSGGPERELALYRDAYDYLSARGWNQLWTDTAERGPGQLAIELAGAIRELAS